MIPLAERIRCVETARRVATGVARPPERAEARDDLAAGLDDASRLLRWVDGRREALAALSPPAGEVSLREQARCIGVARDVVMRKATPPARAAERDYLIGALEAAGATLRWAHAREYELRCIARTGGPAAAPARAGGCGAADVRGKAPGAARAAPRFPIAMRAAMRCAEKSFQTFLGVDGASAAAVELRARCGVASRKQFDTDEDARERWRALDGRYAAWLACVEGEMAPGRGP
jgi:hypothetical protein